MGRSCGLRVRCACDCCECGARTPRCGSDRAGQEAQAPSAPANLHAGAISVPELVLPDGKRLTRGSPANVLTALGPRAQTGLTAIERLGDGQRESRTFRYAGMEFVVVTADDQILAIYR